MNSATYLKPCKLPKAPTRRYEVQTGFAGVDNWENCWHEDDESPMTFASRAEAQQALDEHFEGLREVGIPFLKGDFRIRVVR